MLKSDSIEVGSVSGLDSVGPVRIMFQFISFGTSSYINDYDYSYYYSLFTKHTHDSSCIRKSMTTEKERKRRKTKRRKRYRACFPHVCCIFSLCRHIV